MSHWEFVAEWEHINRWENAGYDKGFDGEPCEDLEVPAKYAGYYAEGYRAGYIERASLAVEWARRGFADGYGNEPFTDDDVPEDFKGTYACAYRRGHAIKAWESGSDD